MSNLPEHIVKEIVALNNDQREVAMCMGHCLAIAAPGSGKTKTLAVKAAHLLSKGHTVSAVTFTRDAALELRDRIILIAGNEVLPRLLVGTFHSIDLLMAFPAKARSGMGSQILSQGYSRLRRQWEIVKEPTRLSIVARAIDASGLPDIEIDEGTRLIEGMKSGHLQPGTPAHRVLVDTYRDLLRRHGVIDFQDILLETNKAIETGQISPLATDHLMIDEFQDTDRVQFEWAMLNAKAGATLTAVGDDDQSIYGFRRALGYQGMVQFRDDLQATRIVLGLNYRSNAEVLAPSAKLIGVNEDRMDKDLISFKGPGGSAMWDRFPDRVEEGRQVHAWAKLALDKGKTVGVLARTNKRLDAVEVHCLRHGTPCLRAEGGSILKSRAMGVFMATLGLLTRDNMLDADEVLAWAKVSEDEINGIHAKLGKKGFVGIDKTLLDKLSLSATSKSTISAILRRRADWAVLLETGGVTFVLDAVFEFLAHFAEGDNRIKNDLTIVREIFGKPMPKQGGIAEMTRRMQDVRDLMDNQGKKKESGVPTVNLLTAHGSKGLEYDYVWIIGAEDGAFPDKTASVQEERRLFFVAMTRARHHLMISASGSKPMSPFVDEAGLMRRPVTPIVD